MIKREDWPQEVPKKPWAPDLNRGRFAKLDERKPPSWRSKRPGMSPAHLINIRALPCAGPCHEREGVEAHHLKSGPAARERGVGMKATDRWAVPLCPAHHAEIERLGSRREREWFLSFGIDCHALAQGLWNAHRDPIRMDYVQREHKKAAIRSMASKRELVVDLHSGEWRRA